MIAQHLPEQEMSNKQNVCNTVQEAKNGYGRIWTTGSDTNLNITKHQKSTAGKDKWTSIRKYNFFQVRFRLYYYKMHVNNTHMKYENFILEVSSHLNSFAKATIQCSLTKKKSTQPLHLATRKVVLRVAESVQKSGKGIV